MTETDRPPAVAARGWDPALWVGIVLAVGLAAGAVLGWLLPVPHGAGPPSPPPPPAWSTRLGVTISTLDLVLLLSLLVVYVRSYLRTRAPYTLGLAVFLGVLFVESAVSSPLLFSAFGLSPGPLGRFLDAGGILLSAALGLFLYLSLQ